MFRITADRVLSGQGWHLWPSSEHFAFCFLHIRLIVFYADGCTFQQLRLSLPTRADRRVRSRGIFWFIFGRLKRVSKKKKQTWKVPHSPSLVCLPPGTLHT